MNKKHRKKGITIIELLFGVSFIIVFSAVIYNFQNNLFSSSEYLQNSLNAESEARSVLRKIISELRSMNYSNIGTHPIQSASDDSIIFYSDINNNGNTERLHYFLDGNLLKVGVVYPSGAPLQYDLETESIKTLVRNVSASSSIFSYFDSSYDGTTEPLNLPINIVSIKLIKVNIPIILNETSTSTPYIISSQISIRNLKENL